VDEAVQLAQHVVRDMARGARLAVEEDRDVLVAQPDFLDEGAQGRERFLRLPRAAAELLVVDRQDETGGAALLLGEGGQVAVAGDAEHLHALALERLGQRAMPRPLVFSERKSSSMMTTGKRKRIA
jgi:hypothetical protein